MSTLFALAGRWNRFFSIALVLALVGGLFGQVATTAAAPDRAEATAETVAFVPVSTSDLAGTSALVDTTMMASLPIARMISFERPWWGLIVRLNANDQRTLLRLGVWAAAPIICAPTGPMAGVCTWGLRALGNVLLRFVNFSCLRVDINTHGWWRVNLYRSC